MLFETLKLNLGSDVQFISFKTSMRSMLEFWIKIIFKDCIWKAFISKSREIAFHENIYSEKPNYQLQNQKLHRIEEIIYPHKTIIKNIRENSVLVIGTSSSLSWKIYYELIRSNYESMNPVFTNFYYQYLIIFSNPQN